MTKSIAKAILIILPIVTFSEEIKVNSCGVTRVAFANELAQAFSKKYNIKTLLGPKKGDTFVITSVAKKEVDLGLGCREAIDTVKEEQNVDSIQVAWGALAFIVNPKNKVQNLKTEQIKDILIGKITNWKEVGGDDAKINLLVRDTVRPGVGVSAKEILFKNRDMEFYSKAQKIKSSYIIRENVAKDINAFAIDNTISASKHSDIKMLKVDGVEPTKENILSDKYKMRQALYIYLHNNPSKLASKFAKFALSKEGQDIISKTGTANLAEASGKDDEDNYMIQNLLMDLE